MATTVLTRSNVDGSRRTDRGLLAWVRAADRLFEDSASTRRVAAKSSGPPRSNDSGRRPILFEDLFEGSALPACLRDDDESIS